jgi:hypothetical protein
VKDNGIKFIRPVHVSPKWMEDILRPVHVHVNPKWRKDMLRPVYPKWTQDILRPIHLKRRP